jgi:hypothetical protein
MNSQDKLALALIVKDYPIIEVLDALQEAIENQIDELVDLESGHSGMTKEMSLVAHHLGIFPRQ